MTDPKHSTVDPPTVVPREVCFLIGEDDVVLWSDASDSPVAMPDNRERWQQIWKHRDTLVEVVHTHPLGGLYFSSTDEDTMKALDEALGRPLLYAVVTAEGMIRRRNVESIDDETVEDPPWWVPVLRATSGCIPKKGQ